MQIHGAPIQGSLLDVSIIHRQNAKNAKNAQKAKIAKIAKALRPDPFYNITMINDYDTKEKEKADKLTYLPYRPRALQRAFHRKAKRWNLIVCHRRFGKSVMGINHLIKAALHRHGLPARRYAYLAPTYRQGKTIAWDYLKEFSRVVPNGSASETELRVDFKNGSRIRIFGCDNPDALRGIYLDGALMDEYDLMPANVFGEIIRPTLSDRGGFGIFMGTPKGRRLISSLYQSRKDDPDWFVCVHKASDTGVIPTDELNAARGQMSSAQYQQEFECSFEASMNGDVFKREHWRFYSELPLKQNRRVHSWDTAFKTGEESDFSAGIQAVECDNGIYITGLFRKRVAFPELKRAVRMLYDGQRPHAVLIEDKASGQSLIQELKRDGSMPILAVKADKDKVTRAHAASPFVEAGNVYLPENAPWVGDFVEECAGFPNVTHDDQVDALTQLINWARKKPEAATIREIDLIPGREGPEDEDWFEEDEDDLMLTGALNGRY